MMIDQTNTSDEQHSDGTHVHCRQVLQDTLHYLEYRIRDHINILVISIQAPSKSLAVPRTVDEPPRKSQLCSQLKLPFSDLVRTLCRHPKMRFSRGLKSSKDFRHQLRLQT